MNNLNIEELKVIDGGYGFWDYVVTGLRSRGINGAVEGVLAYAYENS